MKRQSRRGSLALFFCLTLSALFLIFSILIQAAQIRAAEYDLQRALTAGIQTSLASFDRDWREFGLFGFRSDAPDPTVFTTILPEHLKSCPMNLEFLAPLSDPSVLNRQINRYMKARVPAVYLDLLLEKLGDIRRGIGSNQPAAGHELQKSVSKPASARMTASIAAYGKISGTDRCLQDLLEPFLDHFSQASLKEAAGSLFGGILDRLQDQALLKLQEIYREYETDLFGVGNDHNLTQWLGQAPDFLNPDAISQLAGYLDQMLTFGTSPFYEKICLVEYVLGHFRPAVQKMNLPSGLRNLQTLNGKDFLSLPSAREAEAERILTGFSKPGTARVTMKVLLTTLRSLLHLAAILSDQAAVASLRSAAGTVSGAVAALTAGTVVIDPEILLYLLAVGQAIGKGISDSQKLMAGDGIDFWPGKAPVQVTFYYQDYLRLFLMVIPQSTLLSRTAALLSEILPGPCFTGMSATTVYRQKRISQSGGYQPWPG